MEPSQRNWINDMTTLTFTTSPIPGHDDAFTREHAYEVRSGRGGTVEFWSGGCGYTGYASVDAFKADKQAENDKHAAGVAKRRAEAAAEAARVAAAKPALDRILAAFGLTERDWEHEVWAKVAAQMGEALVAYTAEATTAVALRKLLRPAMTEAKADARSEYPEDYRDADDKDDDFYPHYADDIADSIASYLG